MHRGGWGLITVGSWACRHGYAAQEGGVAARRRAERWAARAARRRGRGGGDGGGTAAEAEGFLGLLQRILGEDPGEARRTGFEEWAAGLG
jgi:hypothetical protein